MAAWAVVSFGCGGNQGLSDPQDGESTAAIVFRDVISEVGMGLRGPTYAAAAADFNRDGRPDLAVSQEMVADGSLHFVEFLIQDRFLHIASSLPPMGLWPGESDPAFFTHGL